MAMAEKEGFESGASGLYLFEEQTRLQIDSRLMLEVPNFSEATKLVFDAADCRDRLVASDVGSELAVESSMMFNESLYSLFNKLQESGQGALAEELASNRLRTTANPYEAFSIYYWAGVQESAKGNFVQATEYTKNSEAVAESIGSHWLAAQSEIVLAGLYLEIKDELLARDMLSKSLDNIELGRDSSFYFPEEYRSKATYGVNRGLRYYLGQKLYDGQGRETLNFCNQVLTKSADPNRRGFLHHWLGLAELLTSNVGIQDCANSLLHLGKAEEYFLKADEPVYAGFVLLDQTTFDDRSLQTQAQLLDRVSGYIDWAIEQYADNPSIEMHWEIKDLLRVYGTVRKTNLLAYN